MSRPAPQVSRPAAPSVQRPNVSPPANFGSVPSFASRPSSGSIRPAQPLAPSGVKPATRPSPGGVKPGTRPSAEQLGDFLGIQGRPGSGNIATLPATNRPVNIANRPININNNIHNRPNWQNLSPQQINNFHNNWHSAVTRPAQPGRNYQNWINNHPDRHDYWHGWGNSVRDHWGHDYWRHGWFNNTWWAGHAYAHGGWHYHYPWINRPWTYWWTCPTWAGVTGWFGGWGWSQPCYYDYGAGGNVVYENNVVYVDGQQIGSTADFAMSAAELATVAPPANEEQVKKSDWLALGTFAVSTSKHETDPSRVLQLAVNKEGIISGTLYNTETDQAQAVQGQVDKQTQRVAFRVGDNQNIVVETGIYNLTQDEAPALVHFGTDRVEQILLVRLDQPQDTEAGAEM